MTHQQQYTVQAIKQAKLAVQQAQASGEPEHIYQAHLTIQAAQQQLSAMQNQKNGK